MSKNLYYSLFFTHNYILGKENNNIQLIPRESLSGYFFCLGKQNYQFFLKMKWRQRDNSAYLGFIGVSFVLSLDDFNSGFMYDLNSFKVSNHLRVGNSDAFDEFQLVFWKGTIHLFYLGNKTLADYYVADIYWSLERVY